MTELAIGDKVSFSYLKGANKEFGRPTLVDYRSRAENYEGTVEDVRDITQSPLSSHTVNYGKIKGERSKNLVTVNTEEGSKAFYDGRMVNTTKIEESSNEEAIEDCGEILIERLTNAVEKLNEKLS